jgi:hypothetical protein
VERTVAGLALAGLAAWCLKMDSEVVLLKVKLAELSAGTKGDLALLTERIETSNRTLFRIEEHQLNVQRGR